MPRIRSIKPEFFTDEDVGCLPPLARLLFIAMWTEADKAGRLKDKPKTLKARCLPFDNINIEQSLQQLAELKFIIRYTHEGSDYIQIRTWEEHQRPHHTERESVYPSCVDGGVTVNSPSNNGEITVKEPSARKREPSLPFLSLPFPSSLQEEAFRPVWESWVNHRVQIKKPLTKEQVAKQLARFGEWGLERSVTAINHTIEKGWQGIREPDESNNGRPARGEPAPKHVLDESLAEARKRIQRTREQYIDPCRQQE